jgi:hypothetical protein
MYRDAYINGTWFYYLATDCQADSNGQSLDKDEQIDPVLISIEQLIKNALAGRMTDPFAVFLAYERLKTLSAAV